MKLLNQDLATSINGNGYNQFGKEVLVTQMPFSFLDAIFEIDPEVQRKLDPQRRSEIRDYVLTAVKKDDFYFSPFVFSARGAITKVDENHWKLKPGCKLYILDGMHRRSGLSSAMNHLKTKMEALEEANQLDLSEKFQEYLDKIRAYPVAMQIYLDLTKQEERQLFTDLNTERREAHIGLIMQYDHRDVYTNITRKIAKELLHKFEIELKLSRLTVQSSALTSLAIIRKCLLAMFEGDLTGKCTDPSNRYIQAENIEATAIAFFNTWTAIFPRKPANRKKYVSGLSGIQIALAYTVYQLVRKNHETYPEAIQKLILLKNQCSWKANDPLFSHLYDPAAAKLKNHSGTTSIAKTAQKFVSLIERGGLQ